MFLLTVAASCLLLSVPSKGGDNPKSVALKDHALQTGVIDYGRDRSGQELVDIFHLVEDANAGNPVAQHQLGLRYLLGKGFTADTAKAASWIGKAANQNLLPARYNYGILLNNGWGVEWNPYDAFRNFQYAANRGMMEAQYIFGLLMTDNLIVQRDYAKSYRWVKMAADSGYEPAADLLTDFAKSGVLEKIRTGESDGDSMKEERRLRSTQAPGYVSPLPDFMGDSVRIPDDTTLVHEALRDDDRSDTTGFSAVVDASVRKKIFRAAEAGSPEALTLVGRWHETGDGVDRDPVLAAVNYLRAIRFDSPRAPILLDTLIRRDGFFADLKARVDRAEPEALYTWSGLFASGFDRQITETQALEFLRRAGTGYFPEAFVGLAMCYYDGRWVMRDRQVARSLLARAMKSGNSEAGIRLLMLDIMQDSSSRLAGDVRAILGQAASDGSILAQSMLGYCYQYGKGGDVNIPGAVKYYRQAARRGSVTAYDALRKLYDERRPVDEVFQIRESAEESIGK